MNSRERVIRTLNHRSVDRAPRDLWLLPGTDTERADEIAEINLRFPSDILHLDTRRPTGKRTKGAADRAGHYTDAWGCGWQLGPQGADGSLAESPLADPARFASFVPPKELLDSTRFDKASRQCDGVTRFVLAWSEARPLDRLLSLRGTESALADIASGNKETRALLLALHDFFRREVEMWAATDVDGVVLGDILASPEGLRMTPRNIRQWFKPLYSDYCEILRNRDKFAFFHSEGEISEVVGDLIDVGMDAVHAHWRLTDFEKLAEKHRNRTTFWGGISDKQIEPPSGRNEIHEAVHRVRRALDYGTGGVIAQCRWGAETPLRNIVTFFEQWLVPLPVNV